MQKPTPCSQFPSASRSLWGAVSTFRRLRTLSPGRTMWGLLIKPLPETVLGTRCGPVAQALHRDTHICYQLRRFISVQAVQPSEQRCFPSAQGALTPVCCLHCTMLQGHTQRKCRLRCRRHPQTPVDWTKLVSLFWQNKISSSKEKKKNQFFVAPICDTRSPVTFLLVSKLN